MARRTAYVASGSSARSARIRSALASGDIDFREVTGSEGDALDAPALGDLIVLDDAPSSGVDALGFVESLRRERADVAIVAITARTDPGRIQALLRAGASACILGDDRRA
ncbi:MAG TPA: hypothetical protein VHK22_08375 [Gaiellaceae bacterium]|jgi:DNA-binding NarL/FixJ family response regulator|nr:hypothetical protein [Gaiellaceae bacterium]